MITTLLISLFVLAPMLVCAWRYKRPPIPWHKVEFVAWAIYDIHSGEYSNWTSIEKPD
jgi:hypothetical protein